MTGCGRGGHSARGSRLRGGRSAASRGLFYPEQLEVTAAPEPVPVPATLESMDSEPSAELLADQLDRVGQQQVLTKKRISACSPEEKHNLQVQKMKKEVTRFLMPDSPQRKRKQLRSSPERSVCRLVPGTPTVPPPKKLQPWELAATATATTRDVIPLQKSGNMLTSSTGVVQTEALKSEKVVIEDIEFEWIGFNPTSTRSPGGQASQPLSPVAGPSQPFGVEFPANMTDCERGGHGAHGSRVRGGCGAACRGLFYPEQLEVNAAPEPVSVPTSLECIDSEPSRELLADQLDRARQQQVLTKKRIAACSPEKKQRLQAQKMKKEVARFLLPDSPKRKRKQLRSSPERSVCRLVPGTPTVPPPKKSQPWEIASTSTATTHGVIPLMKSGNIMPTSSTGVVQAEALKSEKVVVEDIEFEWIGFNPTLTKSPCGQALQPLSPVAGPSQPFGVELPALTSPSGQASQSPSHSPVSGLSETCVLEFTWPEIFEDNPKQWELSANPGSDEEAVDVPAHPGVGIAELFPANLPHYISSELSEKIRIIDEVDDIAIRRIVPDASLYFDWQADPNWFKGVREKFRGKAGPTFPLSDINCPLDAFRKIWDDKLMSLIVIETNRYAERLIRSVDSSDTSRLSRWKPVTLEELWVFLAVCMIQSLIPLPVEEEYWRAFVSFVSMQEFHQMMTHNRFKLLKRCLHFVNSDLQPEVESPDAKKLSKIRPIIQHLNQKFSTLYYPDQEVALDESLLLWKGRLSFAQRIATKAAGIGIKSYELCESKTGYLWKFHIYTGKSSHDHDVDEPTAQDRPNQETAHIVYNLASSIFNRGHTLVMDNFYNSPLLSRCLKLNGTDTMGTLRINREFVPESLKAIAKSQMRVGEFACSQTNDLTVLLWRDANIVAMISSFHSVDVGGKEKYGMYKYKPQVVLDYNLAMGGVDKKDQLLSAYPMERVRNRVWYKKLFRRLLNVSIMNASVLYQYKSNMTARKFRQTLVKSILTQFMPPLKSKVPAQLRIVSAAEGHYPERGRPRGYCAFCRRRTRMQCDICKVPLCVEICFKEYHNSSMDKVLKENGS